MPLRKQDRARVAQEGMTLLRAPGNVTAASAAGVEYAVGADGLLELPTAVAGELLDHGFALADTDPAAAAAE